MAETRCFIKGTIARCNRCSGSSPLPKDVMTIKENEKAWRILDFLTLVCGHMDTHWVYACDQASKAYKVQNRATKERQVVEATSAQEACAKCGWMIGECYVREVRDGC